MAATDERRSAAIAAVGFDYEAQPKRLARECNLCGSPRLTTIAHRDRYGFPARASLCEHCGLAFLNPAMTGDGYAAFYDGVYRPLVSAFHGRRIDAESIQDEQREYAAEVAEMIETWRGERPAQRLLDIGGSTGVVAHVIAQALEAEATVIDPAPLEIAEAQGLGLQTVTGLVEDYDAPPGSFDLILLCQTIDHLLDVRATLEKIRALIADDGLFFVDIVDFRAAYQRNASVSAALKIDHPFSFVEETTELHLARLGFEVVAKEYAADALHVRYLCAPARPQPDLEPDRDAVRALVREIRRTQVLSAG